MAQIVKLEPGDILVLTHMGSEALGSLIEDGSVRDFMAALKEELQLRAILCFEGDVRTSKAVLRGELTMEEADGVWCLGPGVVSGDGGE
ncbi:hypothetical protein ACFZAR_42910 [Streptomyces sp. NPDC008222]|uniref:hypothetical protein n=1 Tax=Streptomyces sp. NPDC008222 TaxID=3364820 RepID=UPI0036EE1829